MVVVVRVCGTCESRLRREEREAGGEQGAGLRSVTTFTKRRKALDRVNGSETPWYSQRPGVDQGRPGLVFTA